MKKGVIFKISIQYTHILHIDSKNIINTHAHTAHPFTYSTYILILYIHSHIAHCTYAYIFKNLFTDNDLNGEISLVKEKEEQEESKKKDEMLVVSWKNTLVSFTSLDVSKSFRDRNQSG